MTSEKDWWQFTPKTDALGEKVAKTGELLLAGTNTYSPKLKGQMDDNDNALKVFQPYSPNSDLRKSEHPHFTILNTLIIYLLF